MPIAFSKASASEFAYSLFPVMTVTLMLSWLVSATLAPQIRQLACCGICSFNRTALRHIKLYQKLWLEQTNAVKLKIDNDKLLQMGLSRQTG